MTTRKYLVLAGVTVFSTLGDSLLARGMKQIGGISLHDFSGLLLAILNPWVSVGILLLLAFFASYMSALSWADLTYVLPATSLSYVLVAVIAQVRFHEQISPTRWLGIALIAAGVGFVAAGPAVTSSHPASPADDFERNAPQRHASREQEVQP
ncbi:MAG: EamA family transporter [Terriglobales bacterium]